MDTSSDNPKSAAEEGYDESSQATANIIFHEDFNSAEYKLVEFPPAIWEQLGDSIL